jgi:hydroxyethylthiazole kinase
MSNQSLAVADLLARIRERKPLVHHITNIVVANDTANLTLAIGALPVMAPAEEEVEEMVSLASALVLNIGTLTKELIAAMLRAGKQANARNIPIILDPVGAGATRFRTQNALHLLSELRIAVLRGNAAEIGALVGIAGETRGVESISTGAAPDVIARTAAHEFGCVVAITGARDVIVQNERYAEVANGHPMLATITGSGCMSTSMIGAFLAVADDPWQATVAGLVAMGIAGEVAAPQSGGPGTFRSHLLDAVAALTPEQLRLQQKVDLL